MKIQFGNNASGISGKKSAGKKREGIRMIFQINRDLKISGRLCLKFDPEKIGCVTPQPVILGNWAKLRKRDIIFSVLTRNPPPCNSDRNDIMGQRCDTYKISGNDCFEKTQVCKTQVCKTQGKKLCTPCRIISEASEHKMTGIDPRHRLHHLSLLPSGSDEVRDRLLRGGRSA